MMLTNNKTNLNFASEKITENMDNVIKKYQNPIEFETDNTCDNITEIDEPFLVPFWKMPFKQNLSETWKFLKFGLSMALSNSVNIVAILIIFIYIGKEGDPILQASFGLGVSYFSFFFLPLCLACYEVTAIQCAKWYGNENFYMMSVSLGQGFILSFIITTFSCLMFWFSEDILLAVNILPENAILVGKMMQATIPGIILMNINFQFMSFCTAQRIERPFGISNLCGIIVCASITGWLVNDLKVGIYVFPICKVVIEVINMCFILFSMFF